MPQEPEIFENTIAYNITLGLPFDEADVLQACETARFTDVSRSVAARSGNQYSGKGRQPVGRAKTAAGAGYGAFWPPEAATSFSSMSPPAASIQKPSLKFTGPF
jgi:hypothetical protein